MMIEAMGDAAIPKISVEQYLAIDRVAELKSEYHDGEMFPMAAGSMEHASIGPRFCSEVLAKLPAGCRLFQAPLRVRVSPSKFLYPDLLVICGKPALTDEHHDTVTNPKVIVEILSPSTADYDAGGKFRLYRELPSFEEYLLISPDTPMVEIFEKTANGTWNLRTVRGPGAVVGINTLGIEFPLASLYADLEDAPN
ncbi:MAG: Uma2 family endonuclease [Bryobacteraceae bacterium]|nr:Uma2 family endonuclease [Bryobacteraceae bacterium]